MGIVANTPDKAAKLVKNDGNCRISEKKIIDSNFKSFKVGGNIRAQKNLLNERSVQIALMPKIDNTNGFDGIITVARIAKIANKEIFAGISWLTMIKIHFASIVVQAILKYEEEKMANGVDKKNKRIEDFNKTELLLDQARKQYHLNRERMNKELNGKNEYNNEFKNIYLQNSAVSGIPNENVEILLIQPRFVKANPRLRAKQLNQQIFQTFPRSNGIRNLRKQKATLV